MAYEYRLDDVEEALFDIFQEDFDTWNLAVFN
jgi:hypothetical protein